MLAGNRRLASLPGELDPFVALAMPEQPASLALDACDALLSEDVTEEVRQFLSLRLSTLAGTRRAWQGNHIPIDPYEIAMQTTLQWPEFEVDEDRLHDLATELTAQASTFASGEDATLVYLNRLSKIAGRPLNPYFYDIDPDIVQDAFPNASPPCTPPASAGILEEPPFLPLGAFGPALAGSPLVLKSPSNAYRLDFLRTLFPAAQIDLVHLVRDQVDTVMGLASGWLHHGFFKHRLEEGALDIAGYSDLFPTFARSFWKFDLPPGFRAYTHRALVEVCQFQWRSANEHILAWAQRHEGTVRYQQIRYATLVAHPRRTVCEIASSLGIPIESDLSVAHADYRRVMATAKLPPAARSRLREASMDIAARGRDLARALDDVFARACQFRKRGTMKEVESFSKEIEQYKAGIESVRLKGRVAADDKSEDIQILLNSDGSAPVIVRVRKGDAVSITPGEDGEVRVRRGVDYVMSIVVVAGREDKILDALRATRLADDPLPGGLSRA